MDARITKKRLNIFLSYDWIKIILFSLVAILVWSLIFTMTATRITSAQQFTIFNYFGTHAGSGFNAFADKGIFSYDILEVNATDISDPSTGATILQTRFATHEGDALFLSATQLTDSKYTLDGEEKKYTQLEQFLLNYRYNVARFDSTDSTKSYIEKLEDYITPFFNGGDLSATGTLNETAVEKEFRERIKTLKDKRFKTESQIKKGLEQEKARIISIRDNRLEFLSYIDSGIIKYETTTLYYTNEKKETVTVTGTYSINLCPDNRMENLKNFVYYTYDDEEQGVKNVKTAKDLCVTLLDLSETKYKYSLYETLSLVNYLVRTYGNP